MFVRILSIATSLSRKKISWVVVLLVAAVLIRIVALMNLMGTPYFSYLLYDENIFHSWAVKLTNGSFNANEAYQFAPLFPYLMAGVYKLFSPDILYIRLLNIFFGVLTCWIIYLTANEFSENKAGLLALALAAFCEPLIFYSIVPLKAALSTLLFSMMVYFLLSSLRNKCLVRLCICGFAVGLLVNVRPHAGVLIPALSFILLLRFWKHSLTKYFSLYSLFFLLLGMVLAVSPFVVRNYFAVGTISLTTTQSGFNFYRANKLNLEVPVNFAETSPRVQESQFRIEASRRAERKMTPEEASYYWKNETLRLIVSNPKVFLGNICEKVILFFQEHQRTDHYNIEFMHDYLRILNWPLLPFNVLMFLGVLGLLLFSSRDSRGKELLVIFICYGSTLVLFFMRSRYRLPLVSILIPVSALFLMQMYAILVTTKVRAFSASIGCCVLIAYLMYDPFAKDRDFTAYLNGHAIALRHKGDIKGAEEYWRRSSDWCGLYSDFANLSLAQRYSHGRDLDRAFIYLDRIPESSYAIAQKYLILGEMYFRRRRFSDAAEAYRKSMSYNSGLVLPLRRLVKIYEKMQDPRKEEVYRQLGYIKSFYTKST